MSEDIYRKLAQRLDAIPNGFPSTESGAELRLLAKMFTPEEAALASVMRLSREPAADIAALAPMPRLRSVFLARGSIAERWVASAMEFWLLKSPNDYPPTFARPPERFLWRQGEALEKRLTFTLLNCQDENQEKVSFQIPCF